MKTTATAVVWRRVLLACLLCALWSEGTVRATELSSRSSSDVDLQKKTEGAKELGEKAVSAQKCFIENVTALLTSLKQATDKATTATVSDDSDKLTNAIKEVKEAEKTAETLKNTAKEVETAVKAAAAGASELWKTAEEAATSQLSAAGKIFTAVETAKKDAETAEGEVKTLADDPKKQKAKDALTKLQAALATITKDTEEVGKTAKTAEKEITDAASGSKKQKPPEHKDVINADEAGGNKEGKKEGSKTPPQDPPGEADKTTKNGVSGNTGTGPTTQDGSKEDSSPDGIPLTVFRLAATSVLFLLARVALVMITA